MTPRPSSLDRVAACPASYAESIGMPSVGSDDTANGNAMHLLIADNIDRELVTIEQVKAQLEVSKADCDPDEMLEAVNWAIKFARSLGYHLSAEEPLGHGTADLLGTTMDDTFTVYSAIVIDWKSSRMEGADTRDRLQLLDYATAAAERFGLSHVGAGVAYPFLKKHDIITLNLDEIREYSRMIEELRSRAEKQVEMPVERRDYRIGEWCGYCPGRPKCPVIAQENAKVASMISMTGSKVTLTPEQLPMAWQWKQRVDEVLESLKACAKIALEAAPDHRIEGECGTLVLASRANPVRLSFDDAKKWLTEHNLGQHVEQMERDIAAAKPPATRTFYPTMKTSKKKLTDASTSGKIASEGA